MWSDEACVGFSENYASLAMGLVATNRRCGARQYDSDRLESSCPAVWRIPTHTLVLTVFIVVSAPEHEFVLWNSDDCPYAARRCS
jgi:hypothetical protein